MCELCNSLFSSDYKGDPWRKNESDRWYDFWAFLKRMEVRRVGMLDKINGRRLVSTEIISTD